MTRVAAHAPISSLQPPYSMFERSAETDILPYCKENNIGVVAYSPMQKGLLTGKVTRERVNAMPETDHRKKDPMFIEPQFTTNEKAVGELTAIAADIGISMAQLSIAWVLNNSAVTSAIVGLRNPQQAAEPAAAGDIELSEETMTKIDAVLLERQLAIA